MKSTLLALALGALTLLDGNAQVSGTATIPTQTFFVPLPERDVFYNTFEVINDVANGNVNSIVAISISTTNTIVWYDQVEDGYEPGYLNRTLKSSTQIWGDGNCANGFAPGTTCTSGSQDVLKAGQSIVLENKFDPTPGANNGFKYGGGDKVLASYPIAITRGAYPDSPGSLMAGAVEVLETGEWGTYYVVPAGQDVKTNTSAFEHTSIYVMAMQDGTVVTTSDNKKYTLNSGQSVTQTVANTGLTLNSTAPVQVDIITGDKYSTYQLRWYALFPRDAWTNSYFSPVGDTKGETKIYLYNPSSSKINVNVAHSDERWSNNNRKFPSSYTVEVPAKSYAFTSFIPTGTGAALTSTSTFIALSITDTVGDGQLYDWGFPVLPSNKMTEKVLVGWGYGCTGKNCNGGSARSVVWVSPWEDADIYVDLNNDGIPETSKSVMGVKRLSSIMVENGADVSGAVIWAVKPGQHYNSMQSVPIAAAWGQNSAYSKSGDSYALDLGTLVPPFIGVRVNEIVALSIDKDGDGMISPGDVVEYTIQVQNAGQKTYASCDYKIKNPGLPANLPRQTYLPGSCVFISDGASQSCSDSALNGGEGLCAPVALPNRGGVHFYKFKATIGGPEKIDTVEISNQGDLTQGALGPNLPFSAETVINFRPSINIEKTVFKGTLATCSNGAELQEGRQGDVVTYCYEVKNTGNSYLNQVVVTDPLIAMTPSSPITLAPNETKFVKYQTTIPASAITTNATVTGNPVLVNGECITTYQGGPVTDTDSAGVKPIPYTSTLSVKKFAGAPGSNCNTAKMQDDTFLATTLQFEYCYLITSTGDECVTGVTLSDNSIGGIASRTIGKVCANSPQAIVGNVTTTKDKIPSTNATVTGTGENSKVALTSRDPAAVDIPAYAPTISIKKYAGAQGSNCNTGVMKDDIYSPADTKFEYCYIITNTGNECITGGTLTDNAVGGLKTTFGKLCSSDLPLKFTGPPSTTTVDIASTPGTVSGKGEYTGTSVTASDPAAIDVPDFQPSLEIKKYAGPVNSKCNIAAMQDVTYMATDLKFEYCYVIKSLGNECALNLSMTADPAVGGIASQTIPKLCKTDAPVMFIGPPTTTTSDVPSTPVTVTGTGEFSKKTSTASDAAAVDVPDYKPSLTIKKYAGPQGSSCRLDQMQDDTYVSKETSFEYCYVITNNGNECVVNTVLTDPAFGGIEFEEIGKICPGDPVLSKSGFPTSFDSNIPSTDAVLTGTGEYTGVAVNVKDPAAVEYVPPVVLNIAINIEKTVHLGDLPTCFDGQELEYGFSGTVVTYCYKVTNTGEVPLNVVVTDGPVGTNESFLLPPGLSTWVKKVSSITADLTSNGIAVGTPTDAEKTVTDMDPAGVKLVPTKPVCE